MDLIPMQCSDQNTMDLILAIYLKLEAIEMNYKVFHKILRKMIITPIGNSL